MAGNIVALTLCQDLDSDGWACRPNPWGGSGTPGSFGSSWDTAKVALDGSVLGAVIGRDP